MRRIILTCTAAAALSFVFLSTAVTDRAHAQSKKAAKAAPAPTYGNADAITEDELKVYDYFLASDQLEGRYFPSRGYDTAALYVASHLAEWGLKPGGSTTGTNGPLQPYFMPIEMVSREIVPDDSKLTLEAPPAANGNGRGGRGGGGQGGGAAAPAAPATNGQAAAGNRGGGNGGRRGNRGGANAGAVTTTYDYGKDWTFGAAGGGGGRGGSVDALDVTGNLVFAGNGYVINKTNANPYQGIDVKGKIIVVAGVPAEIAAQQAAGRGARGGGGGAAENPLGEACKDFWTPEQYAAKNGALAVLTVANFQTATAMAYPNAGAAGRGGRGGAAGGGGRGALNGPPFTPVKFRATAACPAAPNVTAGMDVVSSLLAGEKVSAAQAFANTETNGKVDSFELNSAKKLTIHLAVHEQLGHAENVVGILEGSDPVLKDEYVIMSAHLDHIGLSQPMADGHNVNNGADDDGSGSTGLLGVAHAYAEGAKKGIRPKRSILFLWNGGEERGLWGSQYFTEFPPIDLSKVVADLNMDMIGRVKNATSVSPNPSYYLVDEGSVLVVGPNISSDDLEHTIETVNDGYQKLKIDHFYDVTHPDATHDNLGPQPRGQRIFYRSDHYNFAKVGIPIAFFTIGLHIDYHQPTDTPEKIDYKQIQMISKTVAAVAWQIGNESGRPKLNAKLPDDLMKDMQTVKEQGWGKVTPVLPPLPGEPF